MLKEPNSGGKSPRDSLLPSVSQFYVYASLKSCDPLMKGGKLKLVVLAIVKSKTLNERPSQVVSPSDGYKLASLPTVPLQRIESSCAVTVAAIPNRRHRAIRGTTRRM